MRTEQDIRNDEATADLPPTEPKAELELPPCACCGEIVDELGHQDEDGEPVVMCNDIDCGFGCIEMSLPQSWSAYEAFKPMGKALKATLNAPMTHERGEDAAVSATSGIGLALLDLMDADAFSTGKRTDADTKRIRAADLAAIKAGIV